MPTYIIKDILRPISAALRLHGTALQVPSSFQLSIRWVCLRKRIVAPIVTDTSALKHMSQAHPVSNIVFYGCRGGLKG
jgi:hypothetical protein